MTIAPFAQRRGHATEALTALLYWLFSDLRTHRVFASVEPRNSRSIALMHRLHFRQQAHFRESMDIDGVWVDDLVFAMLQRDWPRRSVVRNEA